MSVKTFKEFREEIGLGEKLVVGDEIIIKSISFAETRYGTVAVFETDKGKRFSGATAIVDVARKITPEKVICTHYPSPAAGPRPRSLPRSPATITRRRLPSTANRQLYKLSSISL